MQDITLHYAIYTTLHYYTTLHRTTLLHYYTRLHYNTLCYIALHSLHNHACNCNYTTLQVISPTRQLQLHYNYNDNYNCTRPTASSSCGEWNSATIATTPKTELKLKPPLGPSVGSLCHPWFTTTNLSYRFPVLKLPRLPCAVLLVSGIK